MKRHCLKLIQYIHITISLFDSQTTKQMPEQHSSATCANTAYIVYYLELAWSTLIDDTFLASGDTY